MPEPTLVTVRVYCAFIVEKLAVTFLAAFMVTVQVPMPLHPPPLHPVKLDPLWAVAVRVTEITDE